MPYTIHLDTLRNQTFAADITAYVRRATWSNGLPASNAALGGSAQLTLTLDGDFTGTSYPPGTLVRLRADSTTLYLGKLTSLTPTLDVFGAKQVILTCTDPLVDLLRAEYYPPLQNAVTIDQPLDHLLNQGRVALPYIASFWLLGVSHLSVDTILFDAADFIALDTGSTTLGFVGDLDNQDRAAEFAAQLLAAEAGGRFFYDTRQGKFIFHNRHRDILNTTVFATLTLDDFEAADYRYGDDLANHIAVRYRPRKFGAPGTVLWAATNVPFELAPRETRIITARYTQVDAFIGAHAFILPAYGEDYVIKRFLDGSDPGSADAVSLSVVFGANAAQISITNLRRQRRYVHTLQIRGTPIYAFDHQQIEVSDIHSIHDYDLHARVIDVPALSDDSDAADFAAYMLQRFKDPVGRFASLTFVANKSATRTTRAITAAIGSRIRIDAADYILVGEQHDLLPATHTVTWILKSVARDIFWVLGVAGQSELGSTTALAF